MRGIYINICGLWVLIITRLVILERSEGSYLSDKQRA